MKNGWLGRFTTSAALIVVVASPAFGQHHGGGGGGHAGGGGGMHMGGGGGMHMGGGGMHMPAGGGFHGGMPSMGMSHAMPHAGMSHAAPNLGVSHAMPHTGMGAGSTIPATGVHHLPAAGAHHPGAGGLSGMPANRPSVPAMSGGQNHSAMRPPIHGGTGLAGAANHAGLGHGNLAHPGQPGAGAGAGIGMQNHLGGAGMAHHGGGINHGGLNQGGNAYNNYHQGWHQGNWGNNYWNGYRNGYRNGFYSGINSGWGYGGWGLGFGYGGFGYGGFGYGGYGLGFGWPYLGVGYGYGGFGSGLGWGLGLGLYGYGLGGYGGWGYGGYGYGYPYYSWGYSTYVNPYYVSTIMQPVPVVINSTGAMAYSYDYSLPIEGQAAPTSSEVVDQALAPFDQARAAFRTGNYGQALVQVDQALVKLPQDANLHEFRALTLFAEGRYDEAATVLYAVLSAGPGWNWPTLIGMYADPNVYTQQVRALEAYRNGHLDQAAPRFVLAYHYLAQGHEDAAMSELKSVVRNQPSDQLSAALLTQLEKKNGLAPTVVVPAAGAAPTGAQAAADALKAGGDAPNAASTKQFPILGTWQAQPNPDTTITLEVKEGGSFTWGVAQKGKPRTISGSSTLGQTGVLTLAGQGEAGLMVGQVVWTDESHFNFKAVGGAADDQGLNFSKQP